MEETTRRGAIPAAVRRRIDRQLRREELIMRLEANASAIAQTRTCAYDQSLVLLLREAANAIRGKTTT